MTESDQGSDHITSIADAVLKLKELRESSKNLNEPDIEERFAGLSLAFKTDKCTLSERLELQKRQRDTAEKNIEVELKALRESLNALNQLCGDTEMRDAITKTQQHVDIVQQSTMRISSKAETYGAIQQEQRMNTAFETMLNYVEHLKQLYDKEHLELEDYRRLLAENNLLPEEKVANDGNDDSKRSLPRSHSCSSASKPEGRTARLVSAVCLLNNNYDSCRITPSVTVTEKNRRASLPVGPMSGTVHPPSLYSMKNTSLMANRNNENISPMEPCESEPKKRRNPLVRNESLDSNKSDDVKDSDSSQEMSGRPSPIPENEDNKDSSYVNNIRMRDFHVDSQNLPFVITPETPLDSDIEIAISSIFDYYKDDASLKTKSWYSAKSYMWLLQKESWKDENTVLRARYVLSGTCAVAAVLSFIATTTFFADS